LDCSTAFLLAGYEQRISAVSAIALDESLLTAIGADYVGHDTASCTYPVTQGEYLPAFVAMARSFMRCFYFRYYIL